MIAGKYPLHMDDHSRASNRTSIELHFLTRKLSVALTFFVGTDDENRKSFILPLRSRNCLICALAQTGSPCGRGRGTFHYGK